MRHFFPKNFINLQESKFGFVKIMSEELRNYDSSAIETLDWYTHIRTRPGMYIGSTGDGSMPDDGLYVLVKEVIDNSIDEYASGFGKEIIITVEGRQVTVRDFGRGVPLEKVVDVSSKLMTGGKFDSGVFKKIFRSLPTVTGNSAARLIQRVYRKTTRAATAPRRTARS